MESWKASFERGISNFRTGSYEYAITDFTRALELGGTATTIYESRAAVYHKLGKLKEALRDCKTAIDLEPSRWQSYSRSARLFLHLRKLQAARCMISLALERVPPRSSPRRDELTALQAEIESAHEVAAQDNARLKSARSYHFGKLPVEIAHNIFSMVLAEDHAYVVTLAQVCQNWRTTVLDTSSFWEILVVKDKHPHRKVRIWKQRSRNRIRQLALSRDFYEVPAVLTELSSLSLDYLQTLRVDSMPIIHLRDHLPSIAQTVEDTIQGIPSTVDVKFGGALRQPSKEFQCTSLHLACKAGLGAWHQLSNNLVDLESCTLSNALRPHDWPHFLWLLYRNPKLVQFHITSFLPDINVAVPDRQLPPTIRLSNLAELRIEISTPDQLFSVLDFPSLTSLHISSCRWPLTTTLDCLTAGPAATLTNLAISGATFDPQRFIKVLAAATALDSLQFRALGNKIANPIVEALARTPSSPSLLTSATGATLVSSPSTPVKMYCPALRHLDCSQNPDVSGGPLVRLVKLRLPAVTTTFKTETHNQEDCVEGQPVEQLQSLIIDECPAVDPDVLPWLRERVTKVSCVYLSKKTAGWKR